MDQVSCSRCGSTSTALERAPLPGEVGRRLLAQTCDACWKQWLGQQVILMNENRLSPADPEHYEFLIQQMTVFLNLHEV